MAFVFERGVRFEEVDAAGIVFFPRFFIWCHEVMERFFDALPGGYVDLITRRRIGFPAVHLAADWKAPLRYGDTARIEMSVASVGTTSVAFRYRITYAGHALGPDPARHAAGTLIATIDHVCVVTNLDTVTKLPVPDDCRALLEAHLAP